MDRHFRLLVTTEEEAAEFGPMFPGAEIIRGCSRLMVKYHNVSVTGRDTLVSLAELIAHGKRQEKGGDTQ